MKQGNRRLRWSGILLVLTVCSKLCDSSPHRSRRSLSTLSKVILTYTGRGAADYNEYGCYCGYAGSGTPVDKVDSCCQEHDVCYYKTFCSAPYFIWTEVRCNDQTCLCHDLSGSCAYKLCTCDVLLGQCLQSTTYNPENKGRCPHSLITSTQDSVTSQL